MLRRNSPAVSASPRYGAVSRRGLRLLQSRRRVSCRLRLAREDSLRLRPLTDRGPWWGGCLCRIASLEARTDARRSVLAQPVLAWEVRPCLGACVDRASLRGFSWLGPKASSFGRSLTASLSLGLSQFATGIGGVSLEAGGGVKRQASNLIRLRPRATAPNAGKLRTSTRAAYNKQPSSGCAPSTTGFKGAFTPWTATTSSELRIALTPMLKNGSSYESLPLTHAGSSKRRSVRCLVRQRRGEKRAIRRLVMDLPNAHASLP